ncbi:hypothetical protein [Akkermansia muciniphila]|uniref:hypothetical protein n=1 Tax=Akkermansia muciniphila TaxID=239935 RepID=UPI000FE31C17|nr:hypothetical protein [Akkermansia muciniphila]
MLSRLFLALALLLGGTGLSRAVHVVMCGGPALRQWEGLRIQPDRHDNWWANFVRASTIRIAHIQQQDPAARITWIVYRPGYATRGRKTENLTPAGLRTWLPSIKSGSSG